MKIIQITEPTIQSGDITTQLKLETESEKKIFQVMLNIMNKDAKLIEQRQSIGENYISFIIRKGDR